jgi:hypothetical protein
VARALKLHEEPVVTERKQYQAANASRVVLPVPAISTTFRATISVLGPFRSNWRDQQHALNASIIASMAGRSKTPGVGYGARSALGILGKDTFDRYTRLCTTAASVLELFN